MKKEIRSKETIKIEKGQTEIRVKTTIDNLKTYNEKIIKENIYLTTPENSPIEFYIKTQNRNNLGFAQITNNGPETYTIEKNDILGYLIEEKDIKKR